MSNVMMLSRNDFRQHEEYFLCRYEWDIIMRLENPLFSSSFFFLDIQWPSSSVIIASIYNEGFLIKATAPISVCFSRSCEVIVVQNVDWGETSFEAFTISPPLRWSRGRCCCCYCRCRNDLFHQQIRQNFVRDLR